MPDQVDFQNVYNFTPHPILAYNEKQVIVYANDKAIEDYFPDQSCIGKLVGQVIRTTGSNKNDQPLFPPLSNPDATYSLLTAGGEQRDVLLNAVELSSSSGEVRAYCLSVILPQ